MINSLDTSLFFEAIFYNSRHNSILIMDPTGKILQVNEAFTLGFGYELNDVRGKNFEILFTESDRKCKRPQQELEQAKLNGSANDENYLVNKSGTQIWVTGECICFGKGNAQCLIKIVHNINASKQLEKFLEEAEEFIDNIFDSVNDMGLLMLDVGLKVVKVNNTFMKMFNLEQPPGQGVNVGTLHPFWNDAKVKSCLRDVLIKSIPLKECLLQVEVGGQELQYILDSKIITDNSFSEKRILVVVSQIR